jgi:phosphate transport system substrate-binding protein
MYNRDTIKLLAIDGVFPDNKSISSGKYPFTSAYYAVIRKSEPKNSPQLFLASRFSSTPEVNFSSTPFPLLGFHG